jgi:hypothetical protein
MKLEWIMDPLADIIISDLEIVTCPGGLSCADYCVGYGFCKIQCKAYCTPFN